MKAVAAERRRFDKATADEKATRAELQSLAAAASIR